MKKISKKVLLGIVTCLIVINAIIIFLALNKNDNNNENVNEYYNEDSNVYMDGEVLHINQSITFNNLGIKDFEVEKIDSNSCEIRATVQNNTENLIEMQSVALKFYDKNGKLLNKIGAQVDSIEAYGTTTLYTRLMRRNISEIYRVEIEQN